MPSQSATAVEKRSRRGRRPAEQVRSEVLNAAQDLLYAEGLRAVTFERVAAAAGASKVTLYKWWPCPGLLAFEAYVADVTPVLVFPDSGDFRRDLRAQLHAFVRALMVRRAKGERTRGCVIAEIVGAAQCDETLARAFHEHYALPQRRLTLDMFKLAQSRGQLSTDLHLESLADQLWGACYHRLILFGAPLDAAYADTLIHNLFGPKLHS